MRLFLDDIRQPPVGDWLLCRSAVQAKNASQRRCPSFVSFDHDLGEDSPSGYDFAKWLVERDLDKNGTFIPEGFRYTVHSANPAGAANIRGLLDGYLAQRGVQV